MAHTTDSRSWKRAALAAALFAIVAAVAAALALSDSAEGKPAKVLGKGNTSKPECCTAMAKVTGIQTMINGKRNAFRVPRNSHIVAWSVDLGKPNKEALEFFRENLAHKRFGSKAYAQLAVLKKQRKTRFKLTKRSKAVNLASSLGEQPLFTLNKPLRVRKGTYIGLSAPTWITNFVGRAGRKSQWLASRGPKRCDVTSVQNREKSRPQMKTGSTRKYGCRYKGEQVLYRVYIVPTGGKKKN